MKKWKEADVLELNIKSTHFDGASLGSDGTYKGRTILGTPSPDASGNVGEGTYYPDGSEQQIEKQNQQ